MPTGAHGTPYKSSLQNNSLQKTKPLLPVKPITHQKSTIYHKPTLYPRTRRVRHTHRLFSFAASDMLKTAAGYYREIHATNISHICRPVRTAHPTNPASKIIPYGKRSPYFQPSLLHTKKSTTCNKPTLYPETRRVRHTHRLFSFAASDMLKAPLSLTTGKYTPQAPHTYADRCARRTLHAQPPK